MKKRLLALTMVLVLLFSCVPLAHAASTPLLYKVTDEEGHVIYLFGTIHVGNDALYPLSDAVLTAFEACDTLAVEIDLLSIYEDPEELLSYSADMYCEEGDSAAAHLGEELVQKAADALDMPFALLDIMKPYGILSLLEEKSMTDALLSADLGVDMYLLEQAREQGMETLSLETLAFQYELLDSMSDEFVAYQIEMYVDYPQSAALSTLLLLNAWKMGDREVMNGMLESGETYGLSEDLIAEMEAFEQKMYGDRDDNFTLQAQEFLKNGQKVFFAVGAAHVAGENGIADQLENLGYTVEEIGR